MRAMRRSARSGTSLRLPHQRRRGAVGRGAPGPVRAFFRKMAFWKKVEEGDVSAAVAARTAELRNREEAKNPGEETGERKKTSDASEKTS